MMRYHGFSVLNNIKESNFSPARVLFIWLMKICLLFQIKQSEFNDYLHFQNIALEEAHYSKNLSVTAFFSFPNIIVMLQKIVHILHHAWNSPFVIDFPQTSADLHPRLVTTRIIFSLIISGSRVSCWCKSSIKRLTMHFQTIRSPDLY